MKNRKVILARRAALAARLDPMSNVEAFEESCLPAYCHPNPLSAAISWWRLATAADLLRRYAAQGPILDFGASTGELAHLIGRPVDYSFVEVDEKLAAALVEWNPRARRERLETLGTERFAAVLALDSLEHNDDLPALVTPLAASLRAGGVLVVSGPTESALYRLGRRISGFSGHYHKQTVYDVEAAVAARLTMEHVTRIPPLSPLFRLSVWRKLH